MPLLNDKNKKRVNPRFPGHPARLQSSYVVILNENDFRRNCLAIIMDTVYRRDVGYNTSKPGKK